MQVDTGDPYEGGTFSGPTDTVLHIDSITAQYRNFFVTLIGTCPITLHQQTVIHGLAMSLPWWVLVVDDDAEVNSLIVEMLCDAGIDARGLTKARAAVQVLEGNSPPGFIIADLTMPEIGGMDLVVHAEKQGIKGMLITAADPRRLAGRSPAPVMRKPFEVEELIRLVERHRPTACAPEPAQVACLA